MGLVHPDFTEAVGALLPGTYIAQIVEWKGKENDKGTRYIEWKLQTVPDRQMFFYITPITGRGAGMFKHMVHSAGDTAYDQGPYNPDKLIGQQVSVVLIREEYVWDGQTRERIKVKRVENVSKYDGPRPQTQPFDDDIGF